MSKKEYLIYSVRDRKKKEYSLDSLKQAGEELPILCKKLISEDKQGTREFEKAVTELLSISMSVWGGGPQNAVRDHSIEEYQSEFYLQLVKYINRFDRSRGCWAAQVKYIRLDTLKAFLRPIIKKNKLEMKIKSCLVDFLSQNDEYMAHLGTRVISGNRTKETRSV